MRAILKILAIRGSLKILISPPYESPDSSSCRKETGKQAIKSRINQDFEYLTKIYHLFVTKTLSS